MPSHTSELTEDLIDTLEEQQDPDTLRAIARYARQLAREYERDVESASRRPDGVPETATLKLDTDDQYFYWEWEVNGAVRTKYHEPVRTRGGFPCG